MKYNWFKAIIEEHQEYYNVSTKEILKVLNISRKTWRKILTGREKFDIILAECMESMFVKPAHFWVNLSEAWYNKEDWLGNK